MLSSSLPFKSLFPIDHSTPSRQLLEHLPLILIIRIPAQSPNPGPDLDHRVNIIQSTTKVLAILLDQLLGHHTLLRGDLHPCRPSYLLAIPLGLADALPGPFVQVEDLFFRLLKGFSEKTKLET